MTDVNRAYEAEAGGRRSLAPFLLLIAVAFLLGIAAMGWLLANWGGAARFLGVAPQPAAPVAAPVELAPAPPPEPQLQPENQILPQPPQAAAGASQPERLVLDPELQRRVAQLEQQVAALGNQAQAAVGNAGRAEGLLVAFAARRALDRGVALGYLEALLRQRFGQTQPQAVGTVIAAARQPVTLEELRAELRRVGPQLTGVPPQESWWSALQTEFGNLITIRRKGTPSTVPAERLRRAQERLEAGQVNVALAEVMRLPGRENGREWIMDARRYVAARNALDAIETAALLGPANPSQAQQPQQQQPAAAD